MRVDGRAVMMQVEKFWGEAVEMGWVRACGGHDNYMGCKDVWVSGMDKTEMDEVGVRGGVRVSLAFGLGEGRGWIWHEWCCTSLRRGWSSRNKTYCYNLMITCGHRFTEWNGIIPECRWNSNTSDSKHWSTDEKAIPTDTGVLSSKSSIKLSYCSKTEAYKKKGNEIMASFRRITRCGLLRTCKLRPISVAVSSHRWSSYRSLFSKTGLWPSSVSILGNILQMLQYSSYGCVCVLNVSEICLHCRWFLF